MEQAKKTISAFFGLTPPEMEALINSTIKSIKPVFMISARVAFVIGFLYCLIQYTVPGVFIGILGWYLIQLERKVAALEKQIQALLDIRYD